MTTTRSATTKRFKKRTLSLKQIDNVLRSIDDLTNAQVTVINRALGMFLHEVNVERGAK